MRRSHDALRRPMLVKCARCGTSIEPHTICDVCGHYRGRSFLEVEEM